jgi:hypothetical protein
MLTTPGPAAVTVFVEEFPFPTLATDSFPDRHVRTPRLF